MIETIEIKGYKSIKDLSLSLKPINILIGSNGVGKSNFISFFKLIHAIFNQRLQQYIIENNADDLLYFGRKSTESLFGKLIFKSGKDNNNAYFFELIQNQVGGLFIKEEGAGYNVNPKDNNYNYFNEYMSSFTTLLMTVDLFYLQI